MNCEETKCKECDISLYRCVIHPCGDLLYDYDYALRDSHLCGICEKINITYYSNDLRVYFPLFPIKNINKLEDKSIPGPLILDLPINF